MSRYELSRAADSDSDDILTESARRWGEARAMRYVQKLQDAFVNLARFPDIGSDVGFLRAGYLRFWHGSHAICYLQKRDHIRIVRVLHQKRRPETAL